MSGHFSALLRADTPAQGPRVPVSVLTGFLGSGKTTLLNQLLASPDLSGTAVIVNEFGEAGLDQDLLTAAAPDDVVLLPNGCLCCAVRGDLVQALGALMDRPGQAIQRVVIETSGLAEPGPILRTLLLDPLLSTRYRLGTVFCTVDAVLGQNSLAQHPEALAQLAAADEVLVTKLDLITHPAETASLLNCLAQLNPSAPVRQLGLDGVELLRQRLLAPRADLAPPPAPAFYHPVGAPTASPRHLADVQSFVLLRDEPLDLDGFAQWLDMVVAAQGEKLLRFKGLVQTVQSPEKPLVVHAIQHLFHPPAYLPAWPTADHRTRLVFITRGMDREALESTLDVMARPRRRRRPT
ncbi:GTP-binding protein [Curvibacter sp. HBC28]|uniref:GTP-binding protein n=1 Tax=Curvibacter microcysteis TaxID=3026419 RepID=A0ABT5MBD7_9BURK|nr:GTP-binding protein [Curvibacter sp. HBC28]MDD0813304.1 GTP-binding protein [Curvibacter sp. HBC28]